MMKDMPSAQGLDGDDVWNDERDVKAYDGYVLMLGKGMVSEKDMESMRDKMMQMQKKMSEIELKKLNNYSDLLLYAYPLGGIKRGYLIWGF